MPKKPSGEAPVTRRSAAAAPSTRRVKDSNPKFLLSFASKQISRLRAAKAIFLSAAVLFPTGALAESLSYDPELCASDAEDKVYVALGRVVLRIPADDLTIIRDLPPERLAEMPAPPNPDEPEGCPDHPIQARGFTFSYLYEAIHKNKRNPELPPGRPNILKLILADADFWGLQPNTERQYQYVCETYQVKEELSNGLTGCWIPMKNKTRPREAWAGYLKADPAVYASPFGRSFVAYCEPRHPAGEQVCFVGYKLYETVNITYRVSVQHGQSDRYLPLEQLIEFDRGLRASIEATRVRDFIWPEDR